MNRDAVISPCRLIDGTLEVPGDKSISHRALLVGAMGEGQMEITGLSPAADVLSSARAIQGLGVNFHVKVEESAPSTEYRDSHIVLDGHGVESWQLPTEPIDVANSGTTIRLLLGEIAGSSVAATLTGDSSIRRRPMRRVVDPLRAMGATIEGEDDAEHAPLRVSGTRLHGAAHSLQIASAQVKSAILLAGLLADGETSVEEPAPSRDHTERLLMYLGVPIASLGKRLIIKSINIQNANVTVPGDMSSAAFFLVAAAMLPGSAVEVRGVGLNPTRTGLLEILRRYGAEVVVSDVVEECGEPRGTVRVAHADRRPLDISGDLVVAAIDELPLIALLGTAADGRSVVHDADELRLKESDRIASVVRGLVAMGGDVTPLPDGFIVDGPTRLRGADVDSAGDHRIAMMLAIAALTAVGETRIAGWDAVEVSYPRFEQDLERLVVR
ncbi:MAG TPA: 3-phosphoshikimate 1-carboxyvinyltransferase [Actinomycetota bacterium]|nr:3-phosphoshikimate 1-carboxyvinyltransferase [Actinomycetota bacterium]